MKTPKISVIMPVYNGEVHLKECIQSVLDQSFQDFEFIITDDASTDSTPKILNQFAKDDSRIKILTHKLNHKQTTAANTAIKNASGKYLARMDADDLALPNRFAKQFKFMESNPKVGLLGSWVEIIDDNGKVLKVWETFITDGRLKWNLLFGSSFPHSSVMMNRKLAEQVGLYQSPEAEDFDLWSRLSRVSEVANLPESLQQKRVWGGQLALKVPTETRDCVLQIMQKNMNYLLAIEEVDLQTVRELRKVSDISPKIEDKIVIVEVRRILNKLYSNYLLKSDLTVDERKQISKDIFKKLSTLNNWEYHIDKVHGKISEIKLAFRFPKPYLYKILH